MIVYTVYGQSLSVEDNIGEEEVKNQLSEKYGFDRNSIYLFLVPNKKTKYIVGFFNVRETENKNNNFLQKFGCPDHIYNNHTDEFKELYDDSDGVCDDNALLNDFNASKKIFMHLNLNRFEEKKNKEKKKNKDLREYVEMFTKDSLNLFKIKEEEKEFISENLEDIFHEIFSKKVYVSP